NQPATPVLDAARSCLAEEGLPATGLALGLSIPGMPVPKGRLGGALGSSRVTTALGRWAVETGTELEMAGKVLGTFRQFGAIGRASNAAAPYLIGGAIVIDAVRLGVCT